LSAPCPHPIKAILAQRRISIAALSGPAHCNPTTLGRVLNGYIAPWPALRRRCAEHLGLPENELFVDLGSAQRLVERTTAAQGLPLQVEDPEVLSEVASALVSPDKAV
jgi:lambda repressor-like predicted transcriptional regulator